MKVVVIGGGPAGLYLGILMKRRDPRHEIVVLERNRPDDTFGFGVVFSDATLDNLRAADPETFAEITRHFAHWDNIDIHFKGRVITSTGHGFSGLSRGTLLRILQERAAALGVRMRFETEVGDIERLRDADLVIGADGVNSTVRERYADRFKPHVDRRPNKFVWLGTTFPYPAFTFYFKENEHGLWRVHAYRYEEGRSTWILECTAETWRRAGMETFSEDDTIAYAERLFAPELAGHRLLKNRSLWRNFPTIVCEDWFFENVVLIGDAVHTAHFSVGSGTKLAMEDSIELVKALHDGGDPLPSYVAARRPEVESLQRSAQVSLQWFEETERYVPMEPEQFGWSLLTRSLRINHEDMKKRDPAYVERIDRWFAGTPAGVKPPPPMFTPYRMRDLVLPNRIVVSPMCMYSADDGTITDWHLVHLGSRAVGGAGLVITEMTDVAREARITPGCSGMYKREHVAAWRRVVEFVHRYTPAKIGMQLAHAGRKGSTRLAWEGMDEPLPEGGWEIVSASPIPYTPKSAVPREMTRADMDRVRDDFVRATKMCDEAGFDLIELHMAHGYLLASFLSPLTNVRKDEYGRDRLKYPLEVFRAVRDAWPAGKPISVRISATDWEEGGNTGEDAVRIATALQAAGADIIDVSAGQTVPTQRPVYGRAFQTPFSDRIRQAGVPTMTVGNLSSFGDVNGILAAGRADLCVMARAHLWDPYWTRHAAYELGHAVPWPPPYAALTRYAPRFE